MLPLRTWTFDHSIRSFLFARFLAAEEGCLNDAGYDEDLLFAATVMHDLELGEHASGEARFEVEGADLAAAASSGTALPNPTLTKSGRRSLPTRLSESPTVVVC